MNLPSGLAIESDVSLAPLTSWIVGGKADHLAQPKTVEDLREALAWALTKKFPVTILGGGTNVLVSDKGVRGLTIALRKMAGLQSKEVDGRLQIECLAGSSKSELLKTFLRAKLEPALFLAGLPGDVGGGVVMNAGVGEMMTPREFVEIVDWFTVLRETDDTHRLAAAGGSVSEIAATYKEVRFAKKDLDWSYRHCEGWQPGFVVRVGLSWPLEPKDDILPRVKAANQTRLSKQPLDLPSCGSVFRNPPGTSSGRVIEAAGLKGYTVGGAKISEKHANFIVNFDDAKATDIHQLIMHARNTVLTQTGIELKTEVVYLGDWS